MAQLNGDARHRQPNGSAAKHANGILEDRVRGSTQAGKHDASLATKSEAKQTSNTVNLLICVGGIYASFLTWGVLQERITTTNYAPLAGQKEIFKYPVVMNTVQSAFAATLGYIYVLISRKKSGDLPIYPSRQIVWPLLLVAGCSALSSPFGYASLQHVDYITFILAKSCKLLPVMFLHVTLYGKRYPFYKYAVVALVTSGVAIFTLHQSTGGKKKKGADGNSLYGLMLLGINLLFDGLTNTTQDDIYARFRPYTGQQMMCALNIMSTSITITYLLLSPYLAATGIGHYVGMDLGSSTGELADAMAFIQRHPAVGWDILGFAFCGAMGQVFIFRTLSIFGSLLLVTITVTRKIFTMIISVVWFGHALTGMQWLGVGLVFGGIGIEAELSKREKKAKEAGKKKM
ncbi:UDP-galactose transporter [Recurvomyces mirabilis]|uniref:UDP-galactose transporter homolog 1 n=1 Tax=Recurvomyces mirabilis TaxID=574656 RepID=A0AAE0TQS9_9PEZI|nr:UDP-galactose transporter [Recurvomyces mirabilis]KAK5150571.1 UDP-galactose transporter [Recurvomyces mirabilis]